jgi:hypothetical protein
MFRPDKWEREIACYPDWLDHYPGKVAISLAEGDHQQHLRRMASAEFDRIYARLLDPVPFSELKPVPKSYPFHPSRESKRLTSGV